MDYRNNEAELRFWGYFRDPQSLDMNALKRYDERAQKYIEECEELITAMRKYRLDLAARADELLIMDNHIRVTLLREKRWKGNVFYFITEERVYSDSTRVILNSTKYAGKERHKAISDFEGIKKAHPQYEFIKDIDKRAWE